MSRRTRTWLPIAAVMLQPRVITGVRKTLINKRLDTKKQYDHGTRQLSPLSSGQPVRIRLRTGSDNLWTEGVCVGQVAPQSYEVRTSRGVYRRNRQMIRAASDLEKHNSNNAGTRLWDSHDDTEINSDRSDNVSPKLSTTSSGDQADADQGSSSQTSDTNESKSSTCAPVAPLEDTAVPSADTHISPKRSRSGRTIRLPFRYRESS